MTLNEDTDTLSCKPLVLTLIAAITGGLSTARHSDHFGIVLL